MNPFRTLFLSLTSLFFFSCSNQSNEKEKAEVVRVEKQEADSLALLTKKLPNTDSLMREINTEKEFFHEISSYLAGKQTPNTELPESIFTSFYTNEYAKNLQKNFEKIEKKRLSKMREWAKTELASELETKKLLFYPFSGPDILHALTFYPNVDNIVMIAMENPGYLPDFRRMDSTDVNNYLQSVNESLIDIFKRSFFVTKTMESDLNKSKVTGATPLICLFLVIKGYTITNIKNLHLNDDGTGRILEDGKKPNNINDYVEIFFEDENKNQKKITYLKANLSDKRFQGMIPITENKGVLKFLNQLPECYTYIKSASYLMNYPVFETMRQICLSKSSSILQDDTGIGFRYFDSNSWDYQLYGVYVKPVRAFKEELVFQKDLEKAYQEKVIKPINFNLGYHWSSQKNEQNLMKFTKKKGSVKE